ncbi:hypothetical protein [Pseudomonas proteolytica]|uniref:hypothetical protein n=1 Tax=Pseudomonas proteolytica TaxID=219574 RepID=UPI00089A6DBA|nr:hypothetical protein [Pseudomonas proteolytica]KAA8702443.1 hypothetical protein F4W61_11540 [Pseudomonas proteolytica]TWR76257.1 hypothetical protein FIV38_24065 [Pseudomonas proteolytica]SEE79781.1 hypothetical protein SAMN04490200_5489 [Pseudomonas proteolytica]
MSHNFKPGDLALIVGYSRSPENVGKSCELVAFLLPGDRIDFPVIGFDGVRHTGDKPGWFVAGDALVSTSGSTGYTMVLEKNLMPLRGDFTPEQQKAKEVEA